MKSFGAAFVLVLSLVNCSQSYKLHGSGGFYNANNKRYNSQPKAPSAVYEPSSYYQQQYQPPQQQQASSFYYDDVPNQNYMRSQPQLQQQQPQYLQYPSPSRGSGGSSVLSDEYNSGSYYYPRQQADYQQPQYGIPTYRGDYQQKPYYFAAQPSYSSADDDHYETTNPLDYLHEEILEENERERTMNNAQFLQNLALYNKHVDSLKERQDQIQKMQDMYNLRSSEVDDYNNMIDSPNDWYDQTSIIVDPETYESIRSNYNQRSPAVDDDEIVKELQGLSKQNHRKSSSSLPKFKNEYQHDYPNDQEMEDEEDDTWINWSKKRSIQPKKNTVQLSKNKISSSSTQSPMANSLTTTMSSIATSTIKLLSKIKGAGQKEVVLPRPASPVRKPFSDSVMAAALNGNQQQPSVKSTPPIYRTIKQIIDMEQSLSHVSTNQIYSSLKIDDDGKTRIGSLASTEVEF